MRRLILLAVMAGAIAVPASSAATPAVCTPENGCKPVCKPPKVPVLLPPSLGGGYVCLPPVGGAPK